MRSNQSCRLRMNAAQAQQAARERYLTAKTGDQTVFQKLRTMAMAGDAAAQLNLGWMHDQGEGVPKDAVQAASWYRKAAEQGLASAQLNLGLMYYQGEGVSKDDSQAAIWFRKAAEQGLASAQLNLGLMYYLGDGVPKDLVIAFMWQNLAAAQGEEIARMARIALERLMTPGQIAEAQKLSREWKPEG